MESDRIQSMQPSDSSLKKNQQLTETPSSGFFTYSPKEWEILVNAIGEQFVNIRTAETKEISKISQPIYWLIGILIISFTILAYMKIISGEGVTFFLGLVSGTLISFLGRYLTTE